MSNAAIAKELYLKQAECIVSVLGSVYASQGNTEHPGETVSAIVAGLIAAVVKEANVLESDKLLERAADVCYAHADTLRQLDAKPGARGCAIKILRMRRNQTPYGKQVEEGTPNEV